MGSRHVAAVALLALSLGSRVDAQVEPPNGFNPSFGLAVRQARYKTPLQRTGITLQLAGAKSIGMRAALRLELGASFFDVDEWADFSTTACTTDPQCDMNEGREAMLIGGVTASVWLRPLPIQRLYFLGGAGTYVVSTSNRGGSTRPGVLGGAGFVLNPDAVAPWSLEVRYVRVRAEHDSLQGLIPIMLSIQF